MLSGRQYVAEKKAFGVTEFFDFNPVSATYLYVRVRVLPALTSEPQFLICKLGIIEPTSPVVSTKSVIHRKLLYI